MADVIKHVIVRGLVQGVGYRYWTESLARRLGLKGWVRNRRDGTVEAVFAGAPHAVAAMIADCRRGPSPARVESVVERDAGEDELKINAGREAFASLPTL